MRRRIALLGALVFLIPFGLYMALVARVDIAELRVGLNLDEADPVHALRYE